MLMAAMLVAMTLSVGCDQFGSNKHGSDKQKQNSSATESADATQKTGAGSSNSDKDGPKIVYKEGPEPAADTVLAEAGDIEVTLADFERAMRQSTLVAPDGQTEAPKERLASPHLQVNVVRNLLSSKIIMQQAERRDLEATLDEKVAALESKSRLAAYAAILKKGDEKAPELEKRGLALEDLDLVATELVLRDKLRDQLVAQIDDEQLWQAYQQQNDRMRLLLAGVRNTPTMEEISAFVEEHPERIEAHFSANKKDYRSPTMVELTILAPEPGKSVDASVLEKAAARLDKGDKPQVIAKDLGLRSDPTALLVRGENPKAFDAEVGSTDFQTSGARGAYAWKVGEKRDSKAPTLTASLNREIAAELLRDQSVVPSKGERVKEAIAALKELDLPEGDDAAKQALDALETKLEAKGLDVEQTPMFARNGRGFIPGVGLAEEVAKKAYELELDAPVADEPILSRGKVWAVRVLDHQTKDREAFEEEKEAFRKEYAERVRDRLVDQLVSYYEDEHDATLDLAPLQIKYGKLQKR
jgi:hypothetical protein